MSILGVNGALARAHCNVDKTQKASAGNGVSFAELAAAKAKHQGWGLTENSSLVNYYAAHTVRLRNLRIIMSQSCRQKECLRLIIHRL